MRKPEQTPEPSIEEILASIRRIIADDCAPGSDPVFDQPVSSARPRDARRSAEPEPSYDPMRSRDPATPRRRSSEDEILELTEDFMVEETARQPAMAELEASFPGRDPYGDSYNPTRGYQETPAAAAQGYRGDYTGPANGYHDEAPAASQGFRGDYAVPSNGYHDEPAAAAQGFRGDYAGPSNGYHDEPAAASQGFRGDYAGPANGYHDEAPAASQGFRGDYAVPSNGYHDEPAAAAQGFRGDYAGPSNGYHDEPAAAAQGFRGDYAGPSNGYHDEPAAASQGFRGDYTGPSNGYHDEAPAASQGFRGDYAGPAHGYHDEAPVAAQGFRGDYADPSNGYHDEAPAAAQDFRNDYVISPEGYHDEAPAPAHDFRGDHVAPADGHDDGFDLVPDFRAVMNPAHEHREAAPDLHDAPPTPADDRRDGAIAEAAAGISVEIAAAEVADVPPPPAPETPLAAELDSVLSTVAAEMQRRSVSKAPSPEGSASAEPFRAKPQMAAPAQRPIWSARHQQADARPRPPRGTDAAPSRPEQSGAADNTASKGNAQPLVGRDQASIATQPQMPASAPEIAPATMSAPPVLPEDIAKPVAPEVSPAKSGGSADSAPRAEQPLVEEFTSALARNAGLKDRAEEIPAMPPETDFMDAPAPQCADDRDQQAPASIRAQVKPEPGKIDAQAPVPDPTPSSHNATAAARPAMRTGPAQEEAPELPREDLEDMISAAELATRNAVSVRPQTLRTTSAAQANAAKAAATLPHGLDDGVREMLKPLITEWLNENLPRLVEKALQEELSARGPLGQPGKNGGVRG